VLSSEGQPSLSEKALFVSSTVISDTNGRYVIVMGKWFSTQVVLANLYAPKWDDATFLSGLIAILPHLNSHHLILGGDLNCVLHPCLDRSRPKPNNVISKSVAVINSFLESYHLSDPQRRSNPTAKQYSFFSSPPLIL
jgi:hypothetical protein